MERVSERSIEVQAMPTGRKASRSSAPGTRSAATSTGLILLMPPGMKVLSPQFNTCWPPRSWPRRLPRSNLPPGVSVEELGAAANPIQGRARQRCSGSLSPFELEVVETGATNESADVLVSELDVDGRFDRVVGDPGVEILVSVVAVDRVGGAARGQADDPLVWIVEPGADAVRQRGVDEELELPDREIDGFSRYCQMRSVRQRGRSNRRSRRAYRAESVVFCSSAHSSHGCLLPIFPLVKLDERRERLRAHKVTSSPTPIS